MGLLKCIKKFMMVSIMRKKNIGILTYHFANNYGAMLQAYATLTYIKGLDANYKVELIDYVPVVTGSVGRPSKGNILFKICKKIPQLLHPIELYYRISRRQAFSKFSNTYLQLSKKRYLGDDSLIENNLNYDFYIAGSDQIWNTTISNFSKAYFLHFVKKSRKIAYAASYGKEQLTLLEIEYSKKYLPQFDFLSVREDSASKLLGELNIESSTVLDPIFLLSEINWRKITEEIPVPKDYIFVYSMEDSDVIDTTILRANKNNLPVIYCLGGGKKLHISGKKTYNASPSQFVYLIAHATLVITNSFHGTAFSILFRKKFISIAHSSRNVRIENLLKKLGVDNLQIDTNNCKNFAVDQYVINSDMLFNRLQGEIEKSKLFLKEALKGVK